MSKSVITYVLTDWDIMILRFGKILVRLDYSDTEPGRHEIAQAYIRNLTESN